MSQGREVESEWVGERERESPTGSLLEQSQQSRLGKAEARCLELHMGHQHGRMGHTLGPSQVCKQGDELE